VSDNKIDIDDKVDVDDDVVYNYSDNDYSECAGDSHYNNNDVWY